MKNKFILYTLLFASLFVSCGETTTIPSMNPTTGGPTTQTTGDQSTSKPTTAPRPSNSYGLEWVIDDYATVKCLEYNDVPTYVASNKETEIHFNVEVSNENYELGKVFFNDVEVFKKEGYYTILVKSESKVEINVDKKIKELKITKNPNITLYGVGDAFDVAGMEVTAVYKDDTTSIVPLNSMNTDGYYVYPLMFEGGEESVSVYYKNAKVEFKLECAVEYVVRIDPNGGVIASSYIDKLEAMNLKNYSISTSGVITFTHFNDLKETITLPNINEITRTGYDFVSWGCDTTISNQTQKSTNAKATWELSLVKIESLSLSVEGEVPYLNIKGKYNNVDSVYLYLYEGQAKISVIGDTYTKTDSNDFNVKFDLRNLSDKGSKYASRWMDIRFNTVVNGKEESMEINLEEHPEISVDKGQRVYTKTHGYFFAVYENKLKVYFQVGGYQYKISFHSDNDHDYVTFTGSTTTALRGNKLQISWWVKKEDVYRSTIINQDGTFAISIDMDAFPLNTNCYAHITILNGNDEILFGGITTNFLQSACATTLPAYAPSGSTIKNCVSYTHGDRTYYIGGNGTGLMLFAI